MTAIAKYDVAELALPPTVDLLDDNAQYTNRFDFVSDSGNKYRIAQHKGRRVWSCSCPSWVYNGRRECKHMEAFQIPGGDRPYEIGQLKVAGKLGASKPVVVALAPTAAPASSKARGGKGGATPAAVAPSVAPKALPAAPAVKVLDFKMVDGNVVVTFDGTNQAAVFALLAQLSG